LCRDWQCVDNECVGDDLDTVLEQLGLLADEAIAADEIADARREAIRKLLPDARKLGAGPAELERVIKGIYVSGTISRWTKDVAGPGGTRKAAPGRAKRKP